MVLAQLKRFKKQFLPCQSMTTSSWVLRASIALPVSVERINDSPSSVDLKNCSPSEPEGVSFISASSKLWRADIFSSSFSSWEHLSSHAAQLSSQRAITSFASSSCSWSWRFSSSIFSDSSSVFDVSKSFVSSWEHRSSVAEQASCHRKIVLLASSFCSWSWRFRSPCADSSSVTLSSLIQSIEGKFSWTRS